MEWKGRGAGSDEVWFLAEGKIWHDWVTPVHFFGKPTPLAIYRSGTSLMPAPYLEIRVGESKLDPSYDPDTSKDQNRNKGQEVRSVREISPSCGGKVEVNCFYHPPHRKPLLSMWNGLEFILLLFFFFAYGYKLQFFVEKSEHYVNYLITSYFLA